MRVKRRQYKDAQTFELLVRGLSLFMICRETHMRKLFSMEKDIYLKNSGYASYYC